MTTIPVYEISGVQAGSIEIADDLTFVDGRVCKGRRLYYKGAGTLYRGHFIAPGTDTPAGCDFVHRSDVFYMGSYVSRRAWQGRFGIFLEPYQPQFSDLIGTCGVKERSIFVHAKYFERSSVEYVRSVRHDEARNQLYFELIYHCGRRKYLDGDGNPAALRELIDYMIASGWNFVWDKASIRDISYDGRVSDVGDLFQSRELMAAYGSVYSVLYSLSRNAPALYAEFARFNGLPLAGEGQEVFHAVKLLAESGRDIGDMMSDSDPWRNHAHIIRNYLAPGRNCGDCDLAGVGDTIRAEYIRRCERAFRKHLQ